MNPARWLYYRFVYRHLMRLLHRFNWHHCQVATPHPYEGKLHHCHWCGLRYLERDIPKIITTEKQP